jgi:4'-phosphopantetheinyl transferase EntD
VPELDDVLDWLRDQLPPTAGVAAVAVGLCRDVLPPSEHELVARASARRLAQFRAGRAAARRALGRPAVILAHAGGDPAWPVGVVGSITHTDDWALAATIPKTDLAGLGIDLEPDTPLAPELGDRVCRPEEAASGPAAAKVVFVAKEAFYKALYPIQRRFMEFHDVSIDLDLGRGRFRARIVETPTAPPLDGAFIRSGALICALCTHQRQA